MKRLKLTRDQRADLEQHYLDIVHDEELATFYWADIDGIFRILFLQLHPQWAAKYAVGLPEDQRQGFWKLMPDSQDKAERVARKVIHSWCYPEEKGELIP